MSRHIDYAVFTCSNQKNIQIYKNEIILDGDMGNVVKLGCYFAGFAECIGSMRDIGIIVVLQSRLACPRRSQVLKS